MESFQHLFIVYDLVAFLISFYLFFLITNTKTGFPSVMYSLLRGIYVIFILIFLFELVLLYGMLNLQKSDRLIVFLFRLSLIPKYILAFYLFKFGLSLKLEFRYDRIISICFVFSIMLLILFQCFQPLKTGLNPLWVNFNRVGYLVFLFSMAIEFTGVILIFSQRNKFKYFKKIIIQMTMVWILFWFYTLFEFLTLLFDVALIQLQFSSNLLMNSKYILSPLFFLSISFLIYRIFTAKEKRIQPEIKLDAYQQVFELTERERQVLSCILKGETNEKIQDKLSIAKSTLKSHINKIFSKCNVKSRLELIYLFVETDHISREILTLGN